LSANEINGGAAAWLAGPKAAGETPILILAGTTFDEFIRLIDRCGGKVYAPLVQLD
jgi:hypothetical protein